MEVPFEIQALVKNLDFDFEEIEEEFLETTLLNLNNNEIVNDLSDCDQKPSSSTFIENDEQYDFEIYQCDICDEVFVANEHLQFHIQNEHGEKEVMLVDSEETFKCESKPNIYSGMDSSKQKQFQCNLCDKTFTLKILKRHKSEVHGPKQFTCEICNNQYTSKSTLRQHILEKHKMQKGGE